ncbi:MAG: hypothetical protein ACREBD_22440, partial [Blastocatellia bacterium]
WPRADAAPDGARARSESHSYKHCAPDGAGELAQKPMANAPHTASRAHSDKVLQTMVAHHHL